ncbi:MAG: hypothetical protein ACREJU_02590 [Nitrospiraceae bacterium]
MEDADDFLNWCAHRHVPLILHGHKHVQRHVTKKMEWDENGVRCQCDVTAVGCGTSLGAEGLPLAYNILTVVPGSKRWSVAFWSDPGDGSGFVQQSVQVHVMDS